MLQVEFQIGVRWLGLIGYILRGWRWRHRYGRCSKDLEGWWRVRIRRFIYRLLRDCELGSLGGVVHTDDQGGWEWRGILQRLECEFSSLLLVVPEIISSHCVSWLAGYS